MSDGGQRARSKVVVLVVAVVLVVIGIVVITRTVLFRDQARAVTAGEAVERYRADVSTTMTIVPTTTVASTTAATSSAAVTTRISTTTSTSTTTAPILVPLVAAGVYRYATTGEERVDALDGTTHAYPSETTITITPTGCGVTLRWVALHERWDEWQLCATEAGVVLQTDGTQYHEFYGQPDEEAIACDMTVVVVGDVTTAPVQQSCTLADDPWFPTWTVLERSTRIVDGIDVAVTHVQMEIDDNDDHWEHTTLDWYLADDGLVVEAASTKSSVSPSPIGNIQYDEHYHLTLESLTPLQ